MEFLNIFLYIDKKKLYGSYSYSKYLITFLIFLIIFSCQNCELEKNEIANYIEKNEIREVDKNINLSRQEIIAEFDTLPNIYGNLIFNIIDSIPDDRSIFKNIWNWNIKEFGEVRISRTNNRLDPKNQLSNETIFLLIKFISVDNLPIRASIYADFKQEKMGTFIITSDSIASIKIKSDSIKIDKL